MSGVVAIGDARRLAGYALAGVTVVPADTPGAVDDAWEHLDADTALLVLTPESYAVLDRRLAEDDVMWVVVPS